MIGPSGVGKSTLLKLITGKEIPDSGTFKLRSLVLISYVNQEHDQLRSEETVFKAISGGNELLISEGGK